MIGVRGLSSVNLRVARQITEVDEVIRPWIGAGAMQSVLVLSPPGFGKTTLLREWVRLVSEAGHPVAVADERGEIAALLDGAPQFALGRCTDVLENCAKNRRRLCCSRPCRPKLIAFDEITAPEDVEAVSLCAPLRHGGTGQRACGGCGRSVPKAAVPRAA